MNRVLWFVALVANALGVAAALTFFSPEVPASVMTWGLVLVLIFAGLFFSLLRPQVFRGRKRLAAALCASVPGVAFVGSLDYGMISGLEWVAIAVAALIGWVYWRVLNQNVELSAKAA